MATTLSPVVAYFVAALHEAGKCLLAVFAPCRDEGIMVFRYVKLEEVGRREVGLAIRAAVAVRLRIMVLVFGVR